MIHFKNFVSSTFRVLSRALQSVSLEIYVLKKAKFKGNRLHRDVSAHSCLDPGTNLGKKDNFKQLLLDITELLSITHVHDFH